MQLFSSSASGQYITHEIASQQRIDRGEVLAQHNQRAPVRGSITYLSAPGTNNERGELEGVSSLINIQIDQRRTPSRSPLPTNCGRHLRPSMPMLRVMRYFFNASTGGEVLANNNQRAPVRGSITNLSAP
jgi:hypothetical protein